MVLNLFHRAEEAVEADELSVVAWARARAVATRVAASSALAPALQNHYKSAAGHFANSAVRTTRQANARLAVVRA